MKDVLLNIVISVSFITASVLWGASHMIQIEQNGPINGVYWTNWSVYTTNYQLKDIPACINTVYYSFMGIDRKGHIVSMDEQSDYVNNNLSRFGQMSRLRHRILAVGGGYYHERDWAPAFKNPVTFTKSLSTFVHKYQLTGIDLDYEPPNGLRTNGVQNIIRLVKAIRLEHPKLFIQLDMNTYAYRIKNIPESVWKELMDLDVYINIMGYDNKMPFKAPNLRSEGLSSNGGSTPIGDAVEALRAQKVPYNRILLSMTNLDTVDGVNEKVRYARKFALAGYIIWDIAKNPKLISHKT